MISRMLYLFLPILFFGTAHFTRAEPWLSNRFAQNCSSCHSPARRNVEAMDRRCTLACQGCHVNPSGGGLRSEYGVWNQQRWLRSFKSDLLDNKGTPAALKHQKYGNMPNPFSNKSKSLRSTESASIDSEDQQKSKGPVEKKDLKKWQTMARDGSPLLVTKSVRYQFSDHDRDGNEYIQVGSRTEFMARLTDEDPYRLERTRSVFGGGNFRYFYLDSKTSSTGLPDSQLNTKLAMAFDAGVRVRPIKEKLQLVFEHRYFQAPVDKEADTQDSVEYVFTNSRVRSAYVLIDDLPYATYIQYGMYRPQFGHYSSDHTSLLNNIMFANNSSLSPSADTTNYKRITANSAFALNQVLSIGGSPNVPFYNFHLIFPIQDSGLMNSFNPFARQEGYAFTFGGRFVTLGASAMISWLSTKGIRPDPLASGFFTDELQNDMLGLNLGFTISDLIVNFDYTTIKREFAVGSSDSGNVITLELKYRFFREMYALLNYGTSNTSRNLKEGSGEEIMMGVKTFLLPGSELEFLYVKRTDKNGPADSTADTDSLQGQIHLFF